MYEKDISKTMEALLPGLIALLCLLIIEKPENFYPWFVNYTILYAVVVLFIRIIAKTIIKQEFDETDTKPLLLGVIIFIVYIFISNITVYDFVVTILQVIVILSFYSTVFNYLKNELR